MKEAIEIFKDYFNNGKASWDNNIYTPKVQSSVYPSKKLSYNEITENIQRQLKIKRNGRI